MSTNYDYRTESIDVNELLPPNIRTDITESTLSTGINRYLTKNDTISICGTVGNGGTNKIPEETLFRSNNQLQPLITSTLDNGKYINSFSDILNKLQQMGVDLSKQSEWLKTEQFNFMPPIDLDKFLNYSNYYWVGEDGPDYIVLNNPISRIVSKIFEATLVGENTDELVAQKLQLENKKQDLIIDHKTQWINANKWVHKSELGMHGAATPAKAPILEYYDKLEVNEWVFVKHKWAYRKSRSHEWEATSYEPTTNELSGRFPISAIDGNTITVNGRFESFEFAITSSDLNNGYYKNNTNSYDELYNTTTITITDHVFNDEGIKQFDYTSNDDYIGDNGLFFGTVTPFTTTSLGDLWEGSFVHWKYMGHEPPVAVNHQLENEYQMKYLYTVPAYGLDINAFDGKSLISGQTQFYGYDGCSRFQLPIDYMPDTDDIQVYLNGVRNYTGFTEGFVVDGRGYYDNENFGINLFDMPRYPKTLLCDVIQFTKQLVVGDQVMVKVGPAALSDIKNYGVYVLGDDNKIRAANLVKYKKHEQVKNNINQYINFDIYEVTKNTAYLANPIFRYKEDINSRLDSITYSKNKKIHNSYVFEQLLFDNRLLCYKDYYPNEQLHTIWRECIEKYTPKIVDGDYELPQQFTSNGMHECRADLSFAELYEHFNSIIRKQVGASYVGGDRICKTLDRIQQIGGTIKEHNSSLDIMISLVHQNIINVLDLIDFARMEYSKNIKTVRSHSIKYTPTLFKQFSSVNNAAIYAELSHKLETSLKSNNRLSDVYYDTTAQHNNTGFVNWIVTLPILGLFPNYQPMIFDDGKINKLQHHDGHFSDIQITTDEFTTFLDVLRSSGVLIESNTEPAPAIGSLWYNGVDIKRCYSDYIQAAEPSGVDGMLWFNTADNVFYIYNNEWVNHNGALWEKFELKNIINGALLSIEDNLYERAKHSSMVYDFNSYINGDYITYITSLKEYYVQYLNSHKTVALFDTYDQTNPFTWNYKNIAENANIIVKQAPDKWGAHWYTIYQNQFNTQYPHLEPWKLQNYSEKPTNWNSIYGADGNWSRMMWSNIKNGIIHPSLSFPESAPQTYQIIPVNDMGMAIGSYAANSLLPPYVAISELKHNSLVSITGQIPASVAIEPSFGEIGFNAKSWMDSEYYPYDLVKTMFKLQPMRFCFDTFGFNLTKVGGLNIDTHTKQVPKHTDIEYHGEMKGQTIHINGVNQWFINYLRYSSNTVGIQDFINLTSGWYLKLSYQFNSVIKNDTLSISSPIFDISAFDYDVMVKKTIGAKDKWLHSFIITLVNAPTFELTDINTKRPIEDNWVFRIDTLLAGSTISRYAVRRYNIKTIDIDTNTFTLHKEFINVLGSVEYKPVTVPWNEHNVRINFNNDTFSSTSSYVIVARGAGFQLLQYDPTYNEYTVAKLYDEMRVYSCNNGSFVFNDLYPQIIEILINAWVITKQPGSSSKYISLLPTINKTDKKIALNECNSILQLNWGGSISDLQALLVEMEKQWGSLKLSVLLQKTDNGYVEFKPNNKDLVYDYNTKVFYQYRTMQNYWGKIDKISISGDAKLYDGGALLDTGFSIADSKLVISYEPTDLVIKCVVPINTVLDEMVDPFYTKVSNYRTETIYHTSVDTNDVITDNMPIYVTGIRGVVDVIDGYASYTRLNGFMVNDFEYPYTTKDGIVMGWQTEIQKFTDRVYYGLITAFNSKNKTYDFIEINPFKYDLRINTDTGIVSNILQSPYQDITLHPGIFDQNGNPISNTENLKIFRTDKQSHITFVETDQKPSEYSKYIGGLHIFVDDYEHIAQFNNYTSNNDLIYDPFLSMVTDSLDMRFDKHYEVSKRPNLSGGIIIDNKIQDNIVTNIDKLNDLYDRTTGYQLLGYTEQQYSKLLDPTSNFLFWAGAVKNKGTDAGFRALVNNSKLSSLQLDEIWSYKITNFGSNEPPVEYLLDIRPTDVQKNRILYQFKSYPYEVVTDQFTPVSYLDVSRWNNFDSIKNQQFIDYETFDTYEYSELTSPFIILPKPCDDVEIKIDTNTNHFQTILIDSVYDFNTTIDVPHFVPNTDTLLLFYNGIRITVLEFTDSIKLPPRSTFGKFHIIYQTGTLKEGIHYTRVSNTVIKLVENFKFDKLTVNAKRYNYDDLEFGILNGDILTPIAKQHPTQGIYNPQLILPHLVDKDPANYEDMRWDQTNNGATWVNTNDFGYLNYNNKPIYSTTESVNYWGNLTPWSDIVCYKWISSDIAPQNNPDSYRVLQKSIRNTINEPFGVAYDEVLTHQLEYACNYDVSANIIIPVKLQIFGDDYYEVFVNESKVSVAPTFNFSVVTRGLLESIELGVNLPDVIRIVRYKDNPINSAIDNTADDALVSYHYVYPYNTTIKYADSGISFNTTYHYWVKNDINRDPLASTDIENMLQYHNAPHVAIIDQSRIAIYHVDHLIANDSKLLIIKDPNIKTKYKGQHNYNTEWGTIRKNSLDKIPNSLWVKLIESMVGRTIDEKQTQLPAYNLLLQDKTNNTSRQFGIGDGQVMGNKKVILNIVIDLLYSTSFEISMGKDLFFENNQFDTDNNIIKSMEYIYSNFAAIEVNTIYFHLLSELVANNTKLDDIFKTSMVVLDGSVTLNQLPAES
jgi:hypothetical protein